MEYLRSCHLLRSDRGELIDVPCHGSLQSQRGKLRYLNEFPEVLEGFHQSYLADGLPLRSNHGTDVLEFLKYVHTFASHASVVSTQNPLSERDHVVLVDMDETQLDTLVHHT